MKTGQQGNSWPGNGQEFLTRIIVTVIWLFAPSVVSQAQQESPTPDTIMITTWKGEAVDLEEVVVSATRTESTVRDIPARINLVTPLQVKALPVQFADEYLQYIPGVVVSRPFGIYSSKSTVTMRGMDGKEQGRVLVLLDGIPLNKADGGSVNWNLVDPATIERIEVVKGPGSSIYGGNAMGGAVNVITRKPDRKIGGSAGLQYGTYNTIGGNLNLSGRLSDSLDKGIYWGIYGRYLQSEGYITQSEYDQLANPYIVKSNMKEWAGGVKLGYDLGRNQFTEIDFIRFNDRQGTGEKIYQPQGNTTDHDTYHVRARYFGNKEKASWNLSLFYLNEHYKRVNEFMRDDYTWYDVLSKRVDFGGLTSYTYQFSDHHRLTGGVDVKQGSVDAEDVYYTSPDIVYNRGKMNTAGLFLQDEAGFFNNRLRVLAGLRLDYARYFDGAFFIASPSGETSFMWKYQDSAQAAYTWTALSPKLSAQYRLNPGSRIYASYARGFRPSVLDDLCRSGRIRGGFKVANSELTPEFLDNFEVGADYLLKDKLLFTTSVFYSLGKDFLYYVNTGDSIDMGFGPRPILRPQNITGVSIFGAELEMAWSVTRGVRLKAGYSYAHSVISEFDATTVDAASDLEGKYLVSVPAHMASMTAYWMNRFVNASLAAKYTGKRWVNDQNVYDDVVGSDRYPAYTVVDARLWRDFRHFYLALNLQNIFDTQFYDSKGAVCPGRFITLEAGVKI